jgi:hypothetical protein
MDSAPLAEKDQKLLTSIGVTLLIVQAAERMLGQSLYRIFGLPELVTVQDLERLDSEARRATLGRLVNSVRERVSLDPMFEQALVDFVQDRNVFVHHFGDRFDLGTSDGFAEAAMFVNRLMRRGMVLCETFAAFLIAFVRRIGVEVDGMESAPGYEDAVRVWGLVSGPLRARVLPPEFDT